MKKKLLITGANGLLGSNLVYQSVDRFDVTACSLSEVGSAKPVDRVRMDVTDDAAVRRVVEDVKPDAIIHCAAETRVDFCEAHPERAARVNQAGTLSIARAAEEIGAAVIYVSSDSAFDGGSGNYSESDKPNPLNAYSRTKVAGEVSLVASCTQHLIVRTNMFGWNMKPKESLSEWVLNRLRAGEAFPGFQDVVFAPLIVNDLAELLLEMYESDLSGLYHVGARDHVSKYEFGRKIAELYDLDQDLIRPSILDQANLTAPRPKVTYLDVTKAERALGRELPTVEEGLDTFLRLEKCGFVEDLKSGLAP